MTTGTAQGERFTNGLRRIATEEEVNAKWGGGGDRLHCYLCSHNIEVGEGWRWVYMNSDPSPSFGNFMVCDKCDGPDVKQRWVAANLPIHEFLKGRRNSEGEWPTPVVAQMQERIATLEAQVAGLRRALEAAKAKAEATTEEYRRYESQNDPSVGTGHVRVWAAQRIKNEVSMIVDAALASQPAPQKEGENHG